MTLTAQELSSTYRTHLYTREHLRSTELNNNMDRIEIAMADLDIAWDTFPTTQQWDDIADLINKTN